MPAPAWFYPLPKAIPTFHPSALPSRQWGGGGWREEGSSGTIRRGLVMVTQRWPDSAPFQHAGLGFSSSFKPFFHHALPSPSPSPCQDSLVPLHRCILGGARPWAHFGEWAPGRSSRAPQILLPPCAAGAAALPPPHSCVTVGLGWVRRARRAPHIPFLPLDILALHLYEDEDGGKHYRLPNCDHAWLLRSTCTASTGLISNWANFSFFKNIFSFPP